MVENPLLGAHVFIYSFHLLGDQYSKIMFILVRGTHIKDLKIRDDTCRHLFYAYKYTGALKMVETTYFQALVFPENSFPV
jgi:hypothetical protein